MAVAQIAGVLEEDIDVKASAPETYKESDDDDSNVVMNFEASEVEVGKKETKPEADQKVPAAEPDKVNVAAIAAGVLGGALLIVLAAVAVKLLLIRRENRHSRPVKLEEKEEKEEIEIPSVAPTNIAVGLQLNGSSFTKNHGEPETPAPSLPPRIQYDGSGAIPKRPTSSRRARSAKGSNNNSIMI